MVVFVSIVSVTVAVDVSVTGTGVEVISTSLPSPLIAMSEQPIKFS